MNDRPTAAGPYRPSLVGGPAQPPVLRRSPMGRMRLSHAAARKADSDPPR